VLCMRASIRTTRRNSPERGSPGRILCLVSCYGKCIQIIATCYPKYEYYATSCRVGGRYRRVAYYDGVGRFVNKVADGGFPKPDRKSTRLNSSHVKISYAVFCLKKKKKQTKKDTSTTNNCI